MKAKPIATKIIKQDVEKLDSKELDSLVSLSKHPGMRIIEQLGEESLRRLYEEATTNEEISDSEAGRLCSATSHMRNALKFLFDAPERAKEEIKRRKKE